MISQEQVKELIKKWEAAYQTIGSLDIEDILAEDFNDAASVLVWTIIQLKNAGYRLSDTDFWYHFSEAN
jgi:hypothetical protein